MYDSIYMDNWTIFEQIFFGQWYKFTYSAHAQLRRVSKVQTEIIVTVFKTFIFLENYGSILMRNE